MKKLKNLIELMLLILVMSLIVLTIESLKG